MARGQSGAAEKQLATTNAVAANQGDKANALENQLLPGYTSLMDTGYFNPREEAAATTSEMGAATAPFSSAEFEGRNQAAATRNPADATAQADQLALEEGQTAGETAAGLEEQKINNQEAGMYGLNQLEQGNLGAEMSMYGLGPGTLDARAAGQSGDQLAQGYVNSAANLISAAKPGGFGCWIAAAVYGGWDEPRTVAVRQWLNTEFTKTLQGRMIMRLYLATGRQAAWLVERSSLLKRLFKPLFDIALQKANGK